jgi:hypothetical protein
MPTHDLPDSLMTDEVFKSGFRGVFYGGCIARSIHGMKEGTSFRHKAHAHIVRYRSGKLKGQLTPYGGWICFRGAKRLNQKSIMMHELAHIITNEGHSKKFYQCVRRMGGRIDAADRYRSPKSTMGI